MEPRDVNKVLCTQCSKGITISSRYQTFALLWQVLGQDKIYACRLQALMADWRQQWASATSNLHMPFGIVQIGPSCGPSALAARPMLRATASASLSLC